MRAVHTNSDATDPVTAARIRYAIEDALARAGGDKVLALGLLARAAVELQDHVSHGYMQARAKFRPCRK